MGELNVAIVGCGQIVTHHVTALAGAGGYHVMALCDPSADRRKIIQELCVERNVASAANPPAEFSTLEELLEHPETAKQCQVIFIAVPHDLHVPIASKALQSGKHVVLEKPLAPTIEGCLELQAVSKTSEGMLIVAEQSPYWQEVVKAKELLDDGSIGEVVTAASYFYESMRDNMTSGLDESGGLGWRCSLARAGGGIVIDGGLHWLRPLRELCGDIDSVVGVIQNAEPGIGLEGETLAHAILKIKREGPNPLLATYSANNVHTAPMAHDTCPYIRLTGTKGELVVAGTGLFPDGGGGLRMYNDEYPMGKDLFPKDRQGGFFLGFQGLWATVTDILNTQDRCAAEKTVLDAAKDVAVALAIYKSAKSGRWEQCELFEN
mmetsp:Transcript_30593/g.57300  ORF Transcript_30593/g.57300 Transcript_30593/m.57300 type:complete len:378 (-) Transcript_30593:50-1183(-)